MPPTFDCMSHFAFESFFNPKISLTFTFVATYAHLIKISHNQDGNSNTLERTFYPSMSFSNGKGMAEI